MNNLNYSLSDDDIEELLVKSELFTPEQVYIITYNELQNIDLSTLQQGSTIVVLYRTNDNYGHWTALYRPETLTDRLFFFDSIGDYTDDSLSDDNIFNQQKNIELGQTRNYLSKKAYDGGYDIEYLDFECQAQKNGINTCGKWVVFFLIFSKMIKLRELESFKRFLRMIKSEYKNNKLSLDDYVNNYIMSLIKKKNI